MMSQVQCRGRHVSKKSPNPSLNIMLCKACEDFVDVVDHKCTCCGNEVRRLVDAPSKDLATIQRTVKEMMPYIETWLKSENKEKQPCAHIPLGIMIKAVRIDQLAEFLEIRPDKYERYITKLKKESPNIAINTF